MTNGEFDQYFSTSSDYWDKYLSDSDEELKKLCLSDSDQEFIKAAPRSHNELNY